MSDDKGQVGGGPNNTPASSKRRDAGMGLVYGAGIGLTFGTTLGVVIGNVGLGISLGLVLGVALGMLFGSRIERMFRTGSDKTKPNVNETDASS